MESGGLSPAIEIQRMQLANERGASRGLLSLQVPTGCIYALTGSNRAARTAVLRALAALARPRADRIRVVGVDVRAEPQLVRTLVGFVQSSSLSHEVLPAGDYLRFQAAAHGIPPAEEVPLVQALLALVDLENERASEIRSLPPERQWWLGLAAAMVHDPEVLLIDQLPMELCIEDRDELRNMLYDLADLGKTVLIGCNDKEDALDVATCVGMLGPGGLTGERLVSTARDDERSK